MKRKSYYLPVFLLCLLFTFLLYFFGRFGIFGFLQSSIQQVFFPLDTLIFSAVHTQSSKPTEIDMLKAENLQLRKDLAQMQLVKSDNAALRDQFQAPPPSSRQLIPATVVGMPGVMPNISFPETLIFNKGKNDGVQLGQVVVSRNTVVGQVTNMSLHFATVLLISAKESSFPVKTSGTNAIGVVKGQGSGEMILDNVVLSDTLKINDTVVTSGNQNVSGAGYPPDLLVGKIVSVDKNPANLFQKARVVPFVVFDRLATVFLLTK